MTRRQVFVACLGVALLAFGLSGLWMQRALPIAQMWPFIGCAIVGALLVVPAELTSGVKGIVTATESIFPKITVTRGGRRASDSRVIYTDYSDDVEHPE